MLSQCIDKAYMLVLNMTMTAMASTQSRCSYLYKLPVNMST